MVVNNGNDTAPLDPTTVDIATLAWLAGSSANDWLLERIHRAGHPELRVRHGYVFQRLLADAPTIGELAISLGVTQQAVSKTVVELEASGHVSRVHDADDRRVRRVALTARGRDAVDQARRARTGLEHLLALDSDAAQATRRALLRLLEATDGLGAVRDRTVGQPED